MGRLAALALVVLIGIWLRVERLGAIPIGGDEIYTLQAGVLAVQPEVTDPLMLESLRWYQSTTPLLWLLNLAPFALLDSPVLAARVVPCAFALVTMLLLPWVFARVRGRRAGELALCLLALSPQHVQFARFGRYQALTYGFGALAMLVAMGGLERRDTRWMVGALALAACCAASHATGALVLVAIGLYWLACAATRRTLVTLGAVCVVVAALSAAANWGWVMDTVLRDFTAPRRTPLWKMLFSVAYNEGLLLSFAALAGAALVVARRQVPEGVVVAATALPAALLYAARFALMGPRFLSVCEGGILVLAVLLFDAGCVARPRSAAVALACVLLSQVPLLLANRVDDQRYDCVALAHYLEREAAPDALVFSTPHIELAYYLGRKTEPYPDTVAELEQRIAAAAGREVYFVVPKQRGRFFLQQKARLLPWLAQRMQLVQTFGRRRLDDFVYRFEIDLFRWAGAK